jgi:hypothetical protein
MLNINAFIGRIIETKLTAYYKQNLIRRLRKPRFSYEPVSIKTYTKHVIILVRGRVSKQVTNGSKNRGNGCNKFSMCINR